MGTVVGARSSLKIPAGNTQGLRLALDFRTAIARLELDFDFVIQIEGLPEAGGLSAGSRGPGDNWRVARGDIDGLEMVVPRDDADGLPLTVVFMANDDGNLQVLNRFAMMVTPEGVRWAFSQLEPSQQSDPEEREAEKAPVKRMRKSVSTGPAKLGAKTIKKALDFGDSHASEHYAAHRSNAYLQALFQGDLSHKPGEPMEADMSADARIALARSLWEAEANQRIAEARHQWLQEQKSLIARVAELERLLKIAMDED
jgi:hypothetical protein